MARTMLPLPEEMLRLPEDELGLLLLRLIVDHQKSNLLNRHNIGVPGNWEWLGPGATTTEFLQAVVEGWDWLASQRLVAEKPGESSHWAFITRRGQRVLAASDAKMLLRAEARLDVDLHPLIDRKVRRQFALAEYDLAALAALKQVEIRVRALAKASADDVGVPLMRKAFHTDKGPLTDPEQVGAERQATMDLFAGAIGVFKNPSSHREVEFDDPTYALEIVLLADLLLRMLDRIEARLAGAA